MTPFDPNRFSEPPVTHRSSRVLKWEVGEYLPYVLYGAYLTDSVDSKSISPDVHYDVHTRSGRERLGGKAAAGGRRAGERGGKKGDAVL